MNVCICMYACVFIIIYFIDDRIVYVMYKDPKAGYVRKVFDPKLGYVSSFLIDGGYIYADRVRITVHTHL